MVQGDNLSVEPESYNFDSSINGVGYDGKS